MKVADLLEQRRKNWQELEQMCEQTQTRRKKNLGVLADEHDGPVEVRVEEAR